MNTRKKYISPIYSPISLDETSSKVTLSPPSDKNEGVQWWATADVGEQSHQKISPFTLSDSSPGSLNGTPFSGNGPF